ncbi:glycosyltransferase family 2 protein [Calothrix membranacea FACHB-236]|nr:glycosyltransferase family 2 protein [Calothrix membranacea FACHB-236]
MNISLSISVVIPTYNRKHIIDRALNSVLSQTLLPQEIIVVDDGSTDGTGEWIESNYINVTLIKLPQNRGASYARNMGILASTGDYIAFLDSDDIWEPNYLELLSFSLKTLDSHVLAVCDVKVVLEDSSQIYIHKSCPNQKCYRDQIHNLLQENYITTMSSVMVRRDAIAAAGLLNPRYKVVHDRDWYIRLAKVGSFTSVSEILVNRFISQQSLVGNLDSYFLDIFTFLKDFFNNITFQEYFDLKNITFAMNYEKIADLLNSKMSIKWRLTCYIKSFIYGLFAMQPNWLLLPKILIIMKGLISLNTKKLIKYQPSNFI